MAISKISFRASEVNQGNTDKMINSGNSQYTSDETDVTKSNSYKYMIGATMVAGLAALAIAGYKGHLGEGVQKFLGGVKKSADDVASQTKKSETPQTPAPAKKELEVTTQKPDEEVTGVSKTETVNKEPQTSVTEEKILPNETVVPGIAKDELFTPEALKGVDGERKGNTIVQRLEDGNERIYEFEPNKNSYTVKERNYMTGAFKSTHYNEKGQVVSIRQRSGLYSNIISKGFDYDELGRNVKIYEDDFKVTTKVYDGDSSNLLKQTIMRRNKLHEVIDYNPKTGHKLRQTEYSYERNSVSSISITDFDKNKGYPLKETCYMPDGKTILYYTTYQPAKGKMGIPMITDVNKLPDIPENTMFVPKTCVRYYQGTKKMRTKETYDCHGNKELYRAYDEDGKTILYEVIYKDGQLVSRKGNLDAAI